LAGKTIAVQTGTTGEAFANENKPEGATIQSFDEASAMFLALESGQVDAVLQDYLINKERADKQGTSAVSVKFEDTPEQYGFAVETGNSALLDILNKGIDALKESGEYQTIYDKYFIG
jgi:polar amino acid transport system substrate-binding protein